MSAIEILKKDHQEVLNTFKLIQKTSHNAKKTREKLINKAYQMILMHSKAEEKLIYPLGLNISPLEQLTREAYEEHATVELLLNKIMNTEVDDESWLAKCSVIKENLNHHIKEEESKMFPALKKNLTTNELKELGKNILDFKIQHKESF